MPPRSSRTTLNEAPRKTELPIGMLSQPFPSYRLYRDNRNRWRWRYDLRKGEALAVSCDSYGSREECESALNLLRASLQAPLWISAMDRSAAGPDRKRECP